MAAGQLLAEEAAQIAASGPRWVAEPVALSPEEAAISLEAEMFRTFGTMPATMPATIPAAAPGGEIEPVRIPRVSAIAAAVENRLAEAGLAATSTSWAERGAERRSSEHVQRHSRGNAGSGSTGKRDDGGSNAASSLMEGSAAEKIAPAIAPEIAQRERSKRRSNQRSQRRSHQRSSKRTSQRRRSKRSRKILRRKWRRRHLRKTSRQRPSRMRFVRMRSRLRGNRIGSPSAGRRLRWRRL